MRLRKLAPVTFDVQFEIQPQTARVPVGRAEQNPVAVHNHQLGVVERRRREPEWQPRSSTCHHIARDAQCTNGRLFLAGKMMSTRTPRSAARFSAETSAGVRQEIRRENLHGRLRLGQAPPAASSASFSKSASGPSVMTRAMTLPASGQIRETRSLAVEDFAGAKRPVVGEGLLQLRDHRAFDAEMQVLDRACLGLSAEHISVADVHAAGEGGFSVHDEDFAVVAEIDGGHAPRRQQRRRQESGEGNLRVLQSAA